MMKPCLLLCLAFSVASGSAWAAKDNRKKQILRRLQIQVQQLEQVRAQAELEMASVQAEREKLELDPAKVKADARILARERAARAKAEQELKTALSELDTCQF